MARSSLSCSSLLKEFKSRRRSENTRLLSNYSFKSSLFSVVFLFFVFTPISTLSTTTLADEVKGNAQLGQKKSRSCRSCHGVDGNGRIKLAGKDKEYLFRRVIEYKQGTRRQATMNNIAAKLSYKDIADLAAFYAANKPR